MTRPKTNQPGVEIPEITKELFELLEPTMFTPLKYLGSPLVCV